MPLIQPQIDTLDAAARSLVSGISPDVLAEDSATAELNAARKLCRSGNPFPLIALQWPEMLIEDPVEAKYFDGKMGDKINPCLRIDRWQRMILLSWFDATIKEIYIKGCTGPGKGGSTAIAANLAYDVFDEVRIHVTSESFSHACKNMFGEIKQWRLRMRSPAAANVNAASIAISDRRYITVLNPRPGKTGESFSGAHTTSHRTLYIFDEATSAESVWFDNAAKNAWKIIAIGNPRTVIGHFRNAFRELKSAGKDEDKTGDCYGVLGRRLCMTVGGMDCLNVRHNRLKEAVAPLGGIEINGRQYKQGEPITPGDYEHVKPLIPGQIDINQYRAILEKSKEPWQVRCYGHGMFPDEDPETQIILSSWIARHVAFWVTSEKGSSVPVNAFGLDVARSLTGDETALAAGSGVGCRDVISFQCDNYPDIAVRVLNYALEQGVDLRNGECPIAIDYGGGYGAGVGDILERAGVWVVPAIPGGRAQVLPEVYCDQRTEDHCLLARRLNPADEWKDDPWAIPDIQAMHEELLANVRVWNSDHTRYRLAPKELVKDSLGRSPDKGDAVALLFRAVREADNLNEFFAMTAGELTVFPSPQDRQPSGTAATSRNPKKQIEDLLSWMKNRPGAK